MTSDKLILGWIRGYRIPFVTRIFQSTPPSESQWTPQERIEIQKQLVKLKDKGAIKQVSSDVHQFISKIFIIPKLDGSYRLILNLKKLNEFIKTEHFKLEDDKIVRRLMTANCFMASVDLQDAYYLIPIREADRKFLRFTFDGNLYEFTCLPFGLSTAPYTFTKIMKPVVSHLRNLGYTSVIYLDDILFIENSFTKCQESIQVTTALLERLGFLINEEKSKKVPSTRCKFLGNIYDSVKMVIELPLEKQKSVKSKVEKFKRLKFCKIRDFTSFIGTLCSCCITLKYGRVYMRSFERERFLALASSNNDFEVSMKLSPELQKDLNWWSRNISHAQNRIKRFDPCIEIFSDASRSGWGACCKGNRTHGFWNEVEKEHHINYLELLAALFGLKCYAEKLKDRDILLRIDNTTAIAYINKKGGVQFPKLSKVAKEIWQWCEDRDLWIFASYISSEDNSEADFESRRLETETEYSLSHSAFNKISRSLGEPEMDLFATRTNTKCEKYFSWKKDPGSFGVDAFTFNWKRYFFYAFPPFSIILRILEKIRFEHSRGILVVPCWPAQAWFPLFMSMLESSPIYFQPNSNLLLSLDRNPHPLWRRITLVAGTISGKHLN